MRSRRRAFSAAMRLCVKCLRVGRRRRVRLAWRAQQLWRYGHLCLRSLLYNSFTNSDAVLDSLFEPIYWLVDHVTRWFGVVSALRGGVSAPLLRAGQPGEGMGSHLLPPAVCSSPRAFCPPRWSWQGGALPIPSPSLAVLLPEVRAPCQSGKTNEIWVSCVKSHVPHVLGARGGVGRGLAGGSKQRKEVCAEHWG